MGNYLSSTISTLALLAQPPRNRKVRLSLYLSLSSRRGLCTLQHTLPFPILALARSRSFSIANGTVFSSTIDIRLHKKRARNVALKDDERSGEGGGKIVESSPNVNYSSSIVERRRRCKEIRRYNNYDRTR